VDFTRLAALLEDSLDAWRRDRAGAVRRLLETAGSGAIKQLVIAVLLAFRREHAELFERGEYRPLSCEAPLGGFERVLGDQRLCVVFRPAHPTNAPARMPTLPPASWTSLLTGATHTEGQDFDAASGGLPFVIAITPAPRSQRPTPA
jgi:(1->4)-alpha-D-glucan 1-alpha-D-glucosylmutase